MDQRDQEKPTVLQSQIPGTTSSTGSGADLTFPNGTILADKYRVLSLIGHGGMGTVYRVEQIFMQHEYALKTLKTDQMTDVIWRRFQKEAQAASRLHHPNLVQAYDFGLLGEGKPYFVMEFLQGQTLSQRIRAGGALSFQEALKIFIPVCFGLEYAHDQGVIHRDLKPSNILLAEKEDGEIEAKVVDFGIAKVTEEIEATTNALTKTGEIFGTPYYMSPEQCKGTKVDSRSDIYSLGCVLFEALTSTPPFQADSALTIITQHLSDRAPSLKAASLGVEFPTDLERIVSRMLAKDPEERYQRMAQVARDLIAVSGGSVPTTTFALEQELPKQAQAPANRTAWTATLCALSLTMGLGAGLAIGYQFFHAEAPKQQIHVPEACPAVELVNQIAEVVQPYCNKRQVTADGNWLFHFPDDRTLGTLTVGFKNNHRLMKGTVKIPAGSHLSALLNAKETMSHPDVLMRFNPDDLKTLTFAGGEALSPESSDFADALMVYVARLKSLDSLNIDRLPVTDKGLGYLASLDHLLQFQIRGTQISARALANFKQLPLLDLMVVDFIENTGTVFKKLADKNVLTYLSAQHCHLSSQDIDQIAKLKNLWYLDIGYNEKLTDQDIAKLASLPKLAALHVNNTAVTARCLDTIAHLPKLKSLSVHPRQFTPEELKILGSRIEILEFGDPDNRPQGLLGSARSGVKNLREFFEKDTNPTGASEK